jgi:hypothetical protein
VFGYFVEYKVFEYLYLQGRSGFTHSHEEYFDNGETKGELDLVFQKAGGDLEVWEIKSAVDFISLERAQSKKEQIIKQLHNYPRIYKHKLIVYSLEPNVFEKIKETINHLMQSFQEDFPEIEFKSEFLILEGMKISDQNKKSNPYQTLFKTNLKEENFKEIF